MKFYYPLDRQYINDKNIRKRGDCDSPRRNRDSSYRGHYGVDYLAPIGSDIYSAAPGKVIYSNYNGVGNGGYGNTVVIRHADGTSTLYAHMKESSDYKKIIGSVVGKKLVKLEVLAMLSTLPHTYILNI
jgi:murein DD-endopeptidase MepM/ murein hydrolase activator NlpD